MGKRPKYRPVPRQLTDGDKTFIKLISKGEKRNKAFRIAYPEHPSVRRYMDAVKDNYEAEYKHRQSVLINQSAKHKLQTKHIRNGLETYQNHMDRLADLSVEVAEDLLRHGRSEKVKGDLAIEFIRHKVGTPVQRAQVQEDKTVNITFGKPKEIIDVDGD